MNVASVVRGLLNIVPTTLIPPMCYTMTAQQNFQSRKAKILDILSAEMKHQKFVSWWDRNKQIVEFLILDESSCPSSRQHFIGVSTIQSVFIKLQIVVWNLGRFVLLLHRFSSIWNGSLIRETENNLHSNGIKRNKSQFEKHFRLGGRLSKVCLRPKHVGYPKCVCVEKKSQTRRT